MTGGTDSVGAEDAGSDAIAAAGPNAPAARGSADVGSDGVVIAEAVALAARGAEDARWDAVSVAELGVPVAVRGATGGASGMGREA